MNICTDQKSTRKRMREGIQEDGRAVKIRKGKRCRLLELPPELIEMIFMHFTPQELAAVEPTCSKFREHSDFAWSWHNRTLNRGFQFQLTEDKSGKERFKLSYFAKHFFLYVRNGDRTEPSYLAKISDAIAALTLTYAPLAILDPDKSNQVDLRVIAQHANFPGEALLTAEAMPVQNDFDRMTVFKYYRFSYDRGMNEACFFVCKRYLREKWPMDEELIDLIFHAAEQGSFAALESLVKAKPEIIKDWDKTICNLPPVLTRRACIQKKVENFAEAEQLFKQAMDAYEKMGIPIPGHLYLAAGSLRFRNNEKDAAEFFEKSFQAFANENRIVSVGQLSKAICAHFIIKNYDRSIEIFDKYCDLCKKENKVIEKRFLSIMAAFQFQNKNFSRSAEIYEDYFDVRRAKNKSMPALDALNAAVANYHNGNKQRAVDFWEIYFLESCNESIPVAAEQFFNAGLAYLQLGNAAMAIAHFETCLGAAMKQRNGSLGMLSSAAETTFTMGHFPLALQFYDLLVQMDDASTEYRIAIDKLQYIKDFKANQ